MKLIGLLALATVLAAAGTAGADCTGAAHQTTAATETTPIPTADAGEAATTPLILPLTEGQTETGEG